jgi:glutathione S-transferase
VIRVYRIPFSTNVERVALAVAHKGVAVEWVDVDPRDRSPVRAVSGQELVPVLEADGEVLWDSPRILAWLEERHPEPPLYPRDQARRAEVETFLDWLQRALEATAEPHHGRAVEARAGSGSHRGARCSAPRQPGPLRGVARRP